MKLQVLGERRCRVLGVAQVENLNRKKHKKMSVFVAFTAQKVIKALKLFSLGSSVFVNFKQQKLRFSWKLKPKKRWFLPALNLIDKKDNESIKPREV